MSAQETTTDLGNCFTVAYVGAITAAENGLTVRVVHGLPIGRGPTNRGERFWHAWVEIHANQWLVIDLSNGRDIRCTRAEYYRIGQIDPHRHLWRYTVGEVERQREADGGRLGPWVPGWQGMGL